MQFPTDRTRRTTQVIGYVSKRFTVCMQTINLNPLFKTELVVNSSHRGNTLAVLHLCRELGESRAVEASWTPACAGVTG